MNPEMKTKWLEALRSGKYKQASSRLRRKNEFGGSYCCLGVLCDISGAGTWDESKTDLTAYVLLSQPAYYSSSYTRSITDLPRILRDQLGISADSEIKLIHLNDEEKADFAAIADWIE